MEDWAMDQIGDENDAGLFDETKHVSVAEVKIVTDLAIFVHVLGGNDHWVPRSQIAPESKVKNKGDKGRLTISAWFAQKERIG